MPTVETLVAALVGLSVTLGAGVAAAAGRQCAVAPLAEWTEPERWAWERICVGEQANFNDLLGTEADPANPQGWDERRELSGTFVETILTGKEFASVLRRQGVQIVGAWFRRTQDGGPLARDPWGEDWSAPNCTGEPRRPQPDARLHVLDLEHARASVQLWLDGCRFESSISLSGFRSDEVLSLDGSFIRGPAWLNSARLSRLHLHGTAFQYLNLRATKIEEHVDLMGAVSYCTMDLDLMQVGQSMLLDSADLQGLVQARYAVIGGAFETIGGRFSRVDLMGAKIGTLRFDAAGTGTRWEGASRLWLRNTSATTWYMPSLWPEQAALDGFHYDEIILPNFDHQTQVSEALIEWLKRDPNYRPGPYERLGTALQTMGLSGEANEIRYHGRERHRRTLSGFEWFGQTLLSWTVGYGYGAYTFRCLWWAAAFVLVGWGVAHFADQRAPTGERLGLIYSVDALLPIITLRKAHKDLDLDPLPRRYFYVHKLVGYVLATFLVAGITGLTK